MPEEIKPTPAKVETAPASTPPVSAIPTQATTPTPPVIQTEKIEATQPIAPTPPITVQTKTPYVRPVSMSQDKAILDYLKAHHNGQFIKLNDFLKSIHPSPVGNEKPSWTNQGNMRKLRQTLMDLHTNEGVVFSNMNYTRLGDNYHDGVERFRKDYNFIDLPIEAKLP